MRIIDMVNGKSDYYQPPPQPAQTNAAFDMLLEEAGRRQRFEHGAQNRNDDTRSRVAENRRTNESPRRRENASRADDTDSAATAATAVIQEPTQNDTAHEAEINEEQAIEKVADILQMPEEAVAEMLTELDITVQELTDTATVTKVLAYALDAENTAELLTDEEFPELYKAINEAVTELASYEKPAAKVGTSQAAPEAKAEAKISAEIDAALEITEENGELVIAESNTEGNTQNNAATTSRESTSVKSTEVAEQHQVTDNAPTTDAALLTADEAILHEAPSANQSFAIEAAAAKVGQTARATAPAPVNATDVIEQIMNQVKVTSAGGNFSEIRMTLRPESLGDIVLRVMTQNGIVMAQFEAENQRVKELLESNFQLLRDSLQESGVQFSELSVFVRQDENERMSQFERARQKSEHRAQSIETVEEEQEISYHNGVIDVVA